MANGKRGGWRERRDFTFSSGRAGHHRKGRTFVSNGQPHGDGDLICCATGAILMRDEEPIEDIIRRDGFISAERY